MRAVRRTSLVLAVCLILLTVCSCGGSGEKFPLVVYCLDIGQGDSTLFRTSMGDILIDTGPEDAQDGLCHRLSALGVEKLALLILTHPDQDHIGGADGILTEFEVEEIWVNGSDEKTESVIQLNRTLETCQGTVKVVRNGDRVDFGDVHLTVLSPFAEDSPDGNEGSIVVTVTCGDSKILMMGDAGKETEERLLEVYGSALLEADYLHAGHHGSDSASSSAFLKAVNPSAIWVSCGKGNSYGHPDGRVLLRMEEVCKEIYRTDLLGEFAFGFDGTCGKLISAG